MVCVCEDHSRWFSTDIHTWFHILFLLENEMQERRRASRDETQSAKVQLQESRC